MSGADWLREGGLHKLADRLHFTGRHDDVDPSSGPEKCADTDCMTLRDLANLAAQQHEALERIEVGTYGVVEDAIKAGEDFKKQHE